MTKVKRVVPGEIHLLTRRCHEQRFFLAPQASVNEAFGYLMAEASERYGVKVLGAVQMSNHYHAVVWDERGELPLFLQRFHGFTARCVNALRGRVDTFWEGSGPGAAALGSGEVVLEKLAYVLCNPVKAGLVESGKEWPGVRTSAWSCVEAPRVYRRPSVVFRKDGAMPEEAALRVWVPPTHAHLSAREFAALLDARVKATEAKLRAAVLGEGRRFGTAREALKVPWRGRPPGPPKRSGVNPRVAGGSKEAQGGMLEDLTVFTRAYHVSNDAFRAGARETVYPGGTWKMVRIHGANAAPPPLPFWQR